MSASARSQPETGPRPRRTSASCGPSAPASSRPGGCGRPRPPTPTRRSCDAPVATEADRHRTSLRRSASGTAARADPALARGTAICSGCFANAMEVFGLCDRCRDGNRLLPGIGPAGQRWCTDCAGGHKGRVHLHPLRPRGMARARRGLRLVRPARPRRRTLRRWHRSGPSRAHCAPGRTHHYDADRPRSGIRWLTTPSASRQHPPCGGPRPGPRSPTTGSTVPARHRSRASTSATSWFHRRDPPRPCRQVPVPVRAVVARLARLRSATPSTARRLRARSSPGHYLREFRAQRSERAANSATQPRSYRPRTVARHRGVPGNGLAARGRVTVARRPRPGNLDRVFAHGRPHLRRHPPAVPALGDEHPTNAPAEHPTPTGTARHAHHPTATHRADPPHPRRRPHAGD